MFEKVEVYTYQRKQDKEKKTGEGETPVGRGQNRRSKNIAGLRVRVVVGQVALLTAGFLLGRAVFLGELMPFGAALVASSFAFYREYAFSVLLGSVIGVVGVIEGWDLAVHTITLVAVGAGALALPRRTQKIRFILGGLVFAILVLAGTGYVAVKGPTTYEYVRILFDATFAALLAVAYLGAFQGLKQLNNNNKISGEKFFCIVLLLVSIVASAGQLQWNYVSPGGILAGLVVIIAGFSGGPGLGASAGAIMGVLPGLVFAVSPAALGAFAFAGFLGGLCRGFGKIGTSIGFLLANTLLTVYLSTGLDILGVLLESTVAALIFLLLPSAALSYMQNYIPVEGPFLALERYADTNRDKVITEKVKHWGDVFKEISHTYEQVCGALEPAKEELDHHSFFNELKNMVCHDCALSRVCWDRDKESTYSDLRECLLVVQKNQHVAEENLQESFRQRCSRTGKLVLAMNCLYQMRRMNQFWEKMMQENRALISEQLRGMHGVIKNLAREMEAENETWYRYSDYFKQELRLAGVSIASLRLHPSPKGFEVNVSMPACHGKKGCLYDVAPLLSKLAGENLCTAIKNCINVREDDFCTVRLYPNLSFQLEMGLAYSAGKGNAVSGDSYSILQLHDGRLAIMLSDGMGTGPVAAAESRAALSLLAQMLKTGFNRNLAVRTVNSLMMTRLPEDSFATVDMLLIDLYEGKAEFVKIGASPSYMVRQNRVDVIQANSLPVGIIDEINIFSVDKEIRDGDMLILATDGVYDAYQRTGDNNNEWISSVLGEIIDLPPQEVADLILRLAISGAGEGQPPDDMTVLVVRAKKSC